MARYIDADQLIKKIYPMGIGDGMYVINAKAVKLAIDNTPSADVVAKSEVARDIISEFANMLKCHSFYMTDAYGEVNENIVTVKAIVEVEEELKKKYTEAQT